MPAQVFGVEEGGMDAAECRNEECPEFGIPKPIMCTLNPDEPVLCGACGQHCEVDWYQGLTYTIPAPPWEEADTAMSERVSALETQMASMNQLLRGVARAVGAEEE